MKKSVKNNSHKKTDKTNNKIDCIKKIVSKWMTYRDAVAAWILDQERMGLSSISICDCLMNEEVGRKYKETLDKNGVTQPNLAGLHQEVTDAALPILEYLFGPNEVAMIPEFPSSCSEGYEKWCEKTEDVNLGMMYRIIGARNKINASEFKTKAKIIPRSGWSSPYPITHWAKVFNISRKTMQSWLENSQIIARKIGSKWQIANEELPVTDDQDSSR